MGNPKKISNKDFFKLLRANAGLYAKTARQIKSKFDIEYSRQAVRQKAEKKPEIIRDIEEENLDIAEEGLHNLMRGSTDQIKIKAIELYLKTKGKKRGYIERKELTGAGGLPIQTENTTTILYIPEKRKEIPTVTPHLNGNGHANGNGLTHTNGTK